MLLMEFIFDGNSAMCAHVMSNLWYLICPKHSIRSRAVTNLIFFPDVFSFIYTPSKYQYQVFLYEGKSSRLTVLDNLTPANCLCTAERVLRVLYPAHAGHRRVLRLLPRLLRVHPGIQLSSSFCKYYTCLFSLALLLFLSHSSFFSLSFSFFLHFYQTFYLIKLGQWVVLSH